MIKVTTTGSFKKTERFLHRLQSHEHFKILERYGPIGVEALRHATPKDSGLADASWYYEVVDRPGYYSLIWANSDVENGFHVAVALQYGHATRNGGYVVGRDYINPAMRPIFDRMAQDMWRAVTNQ